MWCVRVRVRVCPQHVCGFTIVCVLLFARTRAAHRQNLDGKVSLQDFQQSIKQLEGGDALTSDQIDTVFNRCGVDHDGLIALKGFLDFFTGKDARSATNTEGIASGVIPRAFEEVCAPAPAGPAPAACARTQRSR